MPLHFLYLQYLTFVHLHGKYQPDLATEHAFACKTAGILPWCNRVMAQSAVSHSEVKHIKNSFGEHAYTWFVESTDINQIKTLKNAGLTYICDYPAMALELDSLVPAAYQASIKVHKMISEHDLDIWYSVAEKSFGIIKPFEFKKSIDDLRERMMPDGILFYCAFYEGLPAAVSLLLCHDDVVALHWVGTLPEYRKKGLGFAVSHYPLQWAHEQRYQNALLFASTMGRPLYERIGFNQYAMYKIFG